jgi:plastocyanin
MRFLTRSLLVLGTAMSLLTSGSARAQATINVTVGDNFYQPASVTAAPGDNIVFSYSGSRSHPTESDNGSFTTFSMDAGHRTHTLTLTAAGSYGYHCQFHGSPGSAMHATIVVQPLGTRAEAPVALTLNPFPNPASAVRDERVTVSFTQQVGVASLIRLRNVIGRVVREQSARSAAESGDARLNLDISDLPAGVYFVSLVVGERAIETRRLVIQP